MQAFVWVFGKLKPIKLICFTIDFLENGKMILFPSCVSRKFQGGQQHHCSTTLLVTHYLDYTAEEKHSRESKSFAAPLTPIV